MMNLKKKKKLVFWKLGVLVYFKIHWSRASREELIYDNLFSDCESGRAFAVLISSQIHTPTCAWELFYQFLEDRIYEETALCLFLRLASQVS